MGTLSCWRIVQGSASNAILESPMRDGSVDADVLWNPETEPHQNFNRETQVARAGTVPCPGELQVQRHQGSKGTFIHMRNRSHFSGHLQQTTQRQEDGPLRSLIFVFELFVLPRNFSFVLRGDTEPIRHSHQTNPVGRKLPKSRAVFLWYLATLHGPPQLFTVLSL
jgi:hypothetical protein